MSIKLGIVMDPIASIKPIKDSSFAMLLAAQSRGWPIYYMTAEALFAENGRCYAGMRSLRVQESQTDWFELGPVEDAPLDSLDVVLMRVDPPFDMDYIYTTYLLELAEARGTLIVNKPATLRDWNEKLATAWFPELCPPTRVSADKARLRDFVMQHGDVIVKPLDGMGGASIFRLRPDDANLNVILETLTDHGRRQSMAQRYIPEIRDGDKRILMIDGEPAPYALARIPQGGETRGNLAAGGKGVAVPLSARDHDICAAIAPALRERGLLFVGLDVIGDYLTEINITSPTCIRELDRDCGLDLGGELMDAIERQLAQKNT
jgi:glutathione synthase